MPGCSQKPAARAAGIGDNNGNGGSSGGGGTKAASDGKLGYVMEMLMLRKKRVTMQWLHFELQHVYFLGYSCPLVLSVVTSASLVVSLLVPPVGLFVIMAASSSIDVMADGRMGEWIIDSGATHHMTGDPKVFHGRYPEAISYYEKALLLSNRSLSTYAGLAYTYHLQNNFDAAITYYHKALALKVDDKFCTEMLSIALVDDAKFRHDF
ncbi:Anaphase-promoting complex subunit 6 [Nymphaea thermarum]|nr:Anaphase-promoting complex subunit 6 [Nymphaea thermarum]